MCRFVFLMLGCLWGLLSGIALAQRPVGPGPWDRDLILAESADGRRFGEVRPFVERGGVPSLIRDRKDRLIAAFQWFPLDRREAFDRVAVMISTDDGKSWSAPQPIAVEGLPAGFRPPFDPTLALLDDGRIRLYFTGDPRDGRRPAIYSAISPDGARYTFEPGVRFAAEGESVIDCAVGRLGKTWHCYAPVQNAPGRAYHATSEDGLRFTRQADVSLPGFRQWLGCVLPADQGLRFYGTGAGGWSAVSRDGATWTLEAETRAPGADPGVARTRGGRFVMIATGPLRPDAARLEGAGFPPRDRPGPVGPPQPGAVVMTANSDYLFVLRGGMLYQYDAKELRLLKQVRLPEPEPRRPGPPPGPQPPPAPPFAD